MLHEADLRAAHDLAPFLMLQQDPDDGRFRDDRDDPPRHALVLRQGQERGAEARAVVVVDLHELVLHGFGAENRAVDREIAALRVPAHAQRPLREDREEGEIEVLLPADDGIVGAAEGDIGRPVRQQEREGGELRLRLVVDLIFIAAEQQPGEAGARRHAAAKLRDLVRDEHAHALMLPQHVIAPHGLLQRDLRVKAGRDDAAEIQIAQLRQQQIVHLVEAALTDLQIAAPVQIIQNIRHCRTSGHYSRSCKSVPIIHKSRPKRKEGGRKKCLSFSEVLQPINLLTLWGIYAMLMPERRQHRTIGWNCQTPCKGADF